MWLEENCLLWSEQKWKEQFTLLLLVLHRTLIRQDTLKCSKKCVCACGGDLNIFSFTSCWICLTPGGWWPPTTIAIRPHGTTPTQPQMDLHQRRAASEFCQLRWELMGKKGTCFFWVLLIGKQVHFYEGNWCQVSQVDPTGTTEASNCMVHLSKCKYDWFQKIRRLIDIVTLKRWW